MDKASSLRILKIMHNLSHIQRVNLTSDLHHKPLGYDTTQALGPINNLALGLTIQIFSPWANNSNIQPLGYK
jgi:hypothetical protein